MLLLLLLLLAPVLALPGGTGMGGASATGMAVWLNTHSGQPKLMLTLPEPWGRSTWQLSSTVLPYCSLLLTVVVISWWRPTDG